MGSERREGLFEGLPEQSAPARGHGGVVRLRKAERRQVEWRPLCLEDLVPEDHRVRLVWSFVEGLDLTALHRTIKAIEGRPGHPPADPRIVLALWLYATVEGIGSAREIARLCEEHVAFQWLCGGVSMNYQTLSGFRSGHGEVLEQLLVDSFTALIQTGAASLGRVAQDGVRVRASAGAASFRRHATLEECREQAEAAVRRLREEVDANPGAASRRQQAARKRAADDRERRVKAALTVTAALKVKQKATEVRQADRAARAAKSRAKTAAEAAKADASDASAPTPARKPEPEPRASTTDAEARVMKMADGGFRPAYNVQFASDTKSGAIAGVSVDNVGSDMGKMAPMNDALAARYGCRPDQHLADGGFAKLEDIDALTQAGVETYVPVPSPRDPNRDRHAPLDDDSPAIAAWRQRMGTDAAKTIYKQRAATAECANAQARNRGMTQFLVRGIDTVKAVAFLHALTHNMVCTWRLAGA